MHGASVIGNQRSGVHLWRNCAVMVACFASLNASPKSYTTCIKGCKESYRSATMHTGKLVVLVLVLIGIIATVLVWQLGPHN